MAFTYSIESAPKGTYTRVTALLATHALTWSYDRPVFTFTAEGEGRDALIAAGLIEVPTESTAEAVGEHAARFYWVVYDTSDAPVYKAWRSDSPSDEVAREVLMRAVLTAGGQLHVSRMTVANSELEQLHAWRG